MDSDSEIFITQSTFRTVDESGNESYDTDQAAEAVLGLDTVDLDKVDLDTVEPDTVDPDTFKLCRFKEPQNDAAMEVLAKKRYDIDLKHFLSSTT